MFNSLSLNKEKQSQDLTGQVHNNVRDVIGRKKMFISCLKKKFERIKSTEEIVTILRLANVLEYKKSEYHECFNKCTVCKRD